MSTRSLISIKRDEDKYETIYCHWDGYLDYNGLILSKFYREREKVEKLIKLGNISSLNENIDPVPDLPHSFDDKQKGVVVAYGRDRNEKNQESVICTLNELKNWDWIRYIYIYDENNNWIYSQYPFKKFNSLDEDLKDY